MGSASLCRGSVIDISERKRLEKALLQAEKGSNEIPQKMEAIQGGLQGASRMGSTICCRVILSYSSILLGDLKPMDPIRADIEAA